ncbi:MAG: shikimate dehydrogenase [Desulfotignum sp.]|nr:shikimate dehydrogenase [Desulfotignum sp.]MCF8136835.1 shikimate dehydrogenase [Desulfotignum sp.]
MMDVTADTRLFCVLGNPVSHSNSPLIHNIAFADHQIDAVYLAFAPSDIQKAVDAVRQFNIQGVSVTIPFKQSVIPFLDTIDDKASAIGAVNTIVNQNGMLSGYNTDSFAAIAPLKEANISGKTVLVIGAGGAARAVAFGIHAHNGNLLIANRSEDKGRALAARYGADFYSMEAIKYLRPDIIINTTSLGMTPGENVLSCPEDCLTSKTLVMDVVYTPLETRLISVARQKGCHVVDGLTMFIAQAAAQFELWTGIFPDTKKMRHTILTHPDFQTQ